MNEKDKELLSLAISNPERYQVTVDNDSISVWDMDDDKDKGSFTSFGYEFIYEMLGELGCNVQYA